MKVMKKLSILSIFFLLLGFNAAAQEKTHKMEHRQKQATEFQKELNLSEDQKEKLKILRADYHSKMKALRNPEADKSLMRSKSGELSKNYRESVNAVYTAEQRKMLDEKRKSMAESRRKSGEGKKVDKRKAGAKKGDFSANGKTKDLNLSPEQQEALKKADATIKEKMTSVKENKSLTENQRKEQLIALKKEQRTAMMNILTDDQKVQWKERSRPGKTRK